MSVFDEFDLYIWPDPSVMKMKVNGSPSRGAIVISYDTVSEGSYASVEPGMTLIVKNAGQAGLDVRVRLRTITSSQITIAENGIIWSNDQNLEAVKTYEVWGVAPRIVTSGGVTTVYKDYNIEYVDQLHHFDPVVNMGGHYAGPIGEPVYFSATGTFDPQGYALVTGTWTIEGSEGGTYVGATPGYVRFTAPGTYIASCTYVNNQGKSFTGRRHIIIGEPLRNWGMSSFEGGRDRGGYSIKVWLREYVPYLREGSLIVVRSKVNVSNDPRGNIAFVGYVMQKSLKFNYSNNQVEFEAVSINGVMDKLDVFGSTTTYSESLDPVFPYWFQIWRQTVDKAVIAFLRWHTTVLIVTDFHKVGNPYPVEKIDFQRGGAANPIREIYRGTIQADLLCDVQGNLWAEYIQNQRPLADRTTVVKESLQPHMWRDEVEIIDHEMSDISYLEVGGVAYTGATGTSVAALAGYPSTVPGRFGKVENVQGLVLPTTDYQNYLNEITGHLYADKTNRFPDLKFLMSGNRRDYDITPHKWTLLSLVKDFANFLNIRISPTDISHIYNPRLKSVLTDITFEAETFGVPAVTIPIPPPIPEEPPAPPPPPLPIPEPLPPIIVDIVVAMDNNHLGRSLDFYSEPTPSWLNLSTGAMAAAIAAGAHFVNVALSPTGEAWVITGLDDPGTNGLWYCSDITTAVPSFILICSHTAAVLLDGGGTVLNALGCSETGIAYCTMGQNYSGFGSYLWGKTALVRATGPLLPTGNSQYGICSGVGPYVRLSLGAGGVPANGVRVLIGASNYDALYWPGASPEPTHVAVGFIIVGTWLCLYADGADHGNPIVGGVGRFLTVSGIHALSIRFADEMLMDVDVALDTPLHAFGAVRTFGGCCNGPAGYGEILAVAQESVTGSFIIMRHTGATEWEIKDGDWIAKMDAWTGWDGAGHSTPMIVTTSVTQQQE